MLTLRVISRLLAYPDESLKAGLADLADAVEQEGLLSGEARAGVLRLIDAMAHTPLFDLQESYVESFDRGRALSLHLFEHVHGESRDRGQAMVDLLDLYRAHGLELDARELPDYLPLMLEFLSTCDREQVDALLGDAMGVIVLLGARLRERDSNYAALFDALEQIAGTPDEAEALRTTATQEGPDESITRMDEIWEEEQVTFLATRDPAGNGCDSGDGARGGVGLHRPTGVAAAHGRADGNAVGLDEVAAALRSRVSAHRQAE